MATERNPFEQIPEEISNIIDMPQQEEMGEGPAFYPEDDGGSRYSELKLPWGDCITHPWDTSDDDADDVRVVVGVSENEVVAVDVGVVVTDVVCDVVRLVVAVNVAVVVCVNVTVVVCVNVAVEVGVCESVVV